MQVPVLPTVLTFSTGRYHAMSRPVLMRGTMSHHNTRFPVLTREMLLQSNGANRRQRTARTNAARNSTSRYRVEVLPTAAYAMSSTTLAYAATYVLREVRLRFPYAMSGTDLAYAATRSPVLTLRTLPRTCYAMPRTALLYAATPCPVLSKHVMLLGKYGSTRPGYAPTPLSYALAMRFPVLA
eukprot:1521024-Rhodomonas_salina.2